jgi:ABC-type multidrug transport system, ATPase component
MRLLTGLSNPDSGAIRVCVVDVDDRRAIAAHVGYLPETPPLSDEFSAREQLDHQLVRVEPIA